jgi:hypothetical protein
MPAVKVTFLQVMPEKGNREGGGGEKAERKGRWKGRSMWIASAVPREQL